MSATADDCFHLTIEIVREIHDESLSKFGGLRGLRDKDLLASAVFAPQSSFGGKSPFTDLLDVAAAYLLLPLPESSLSRRQQANGNGRGDCFSPA